MHVSFLNWELARERQTLHQHSVEEVLSLLAIPIVLPGHASCCRPALCSAGFYLPDIVILGDLLVGLRKVPCDDFASCPAAATGTRSTACRPAHEVLPAGGDASTRASRPMP